MADHVGQAGQQGAAHVAGQLAVGAAGNSVAIREVLPAAVVSSQNLPKTRNNSDPKTIPLTFRRVRPKPTSSKKVGGAKRKISKRPRVETELSSTRDDQWLVVEDSNKFDDDTSYILNIPCRFNCGLHFDSLVSADEHVKATHAKPRLTQIQSQQPLARLPTPNPVLTQITSHSNAFIPVPNNVPASPLPVIPHPCDLCGTCYGTNADLADHVRRRHPAPVPSALLCPLVGCAVSLSSEPELVAHIVSNHSVSAPNQTNPQNANLNVPSCSIVPALAGLSLSNASDSSLLSSLAQPSALSLSQHQGYASNPWGFSNQLKSGKDRMSNQKPKVNVLWPQECVDGILAKRTFAYSELSPSALAAGCIASLFRTTEFYQCPESVQVYLQHVSYIFHCLSYSNNVKAVLDFHASILQQVEAGLITWSNVHDQTFTLQRLNFRAGLKDLSPSSGTYNSGTSNENNKKRDEQSKRKTEVDRVVCSDFKVGKCSQSGDHGGKRHVCHFCWWIRNMPNATHSPLECPDDPRRK